MLSSLCFSPGPALAEDIRLDDCTIRGADSFVDEYYMWRYTGGGSVVQPFSWGQFFHDGDEFCLIDAPPSTYSADFFFRSILPETNIELFAHYTNDEESSRIFTLEQTPVPGNPWRKKCVFFSNMLSGLLI